MAPPRIHATPADRKRAHRERKEILVEQVEALIEALTQACERGRCAGLTNHLPEETGAKVRELTARLESRRLIVCRREDEKD